MESIPEITGPRAHRRARRSLLGASISLAAIALGACGTSQGAEPERETSYGAAGAVGEGTARAYVETTAGAPVEVGIVLSEAALRGLPDGHAHGGVPMPDGHQIHFYTIPNEERRTIDPGHPLWAERARRLPSPERMPRGYLDGSVLMGVEPELASVPGMGMHWLDPASPELNGQPFTTTFIYGSWDGKPTFAEPMITRAFLETRSDFTAELPAPASPAPGMYYPTSYSVRWDAARAEYRISLGSPVAGS